LESIQFLLCHSREKNLTSHNHLDDVSPLPLDPIAPPPHHPEVPLTQMLPPTILALNLFVSPCTPTTSRYCHVRWTASPNMLPFSGRGCGLPRLDPDVALSPGERPGGAQCYHPLSFSILTKHSVTHMKRLARSSTPRKTEEVVSPDSARSANVVPKARSTEVIHHFF
jgi:hypothetical protein